ncbi:unnamed protein product, partial [Vitis vinifera]
MARHLLEASLMGFLLFLALMIDRLHHYIRELRLLRKAMEAEKKIKTLRASWSQLTKVYNLESKKSTQVRPLDNQVSHPFIYLRYLRFKRVISRRISPTMQVVYE